MTGRRLDGRVVLVTGAAQGIGAAIARLFARHGAALALCDKNELTLVTDTASAEGVQVLPGRLDARDSPAVHHFVAAAADRFGRIDVLVNNAGGTFAAPFLDLSAKGEAVLIEENFTQATTFIRESVPFMPHGGSIVNITSSEAFQAAPGHAIYGAMKAALTSLTRSLALELAPRVRVNAIAPDALPTEGELSLRETPPPAGYEPVRTPPMGRLGSPDDAAEAALYLTEAGFVTGTTLHVDGGIRAAGGWRRNHG